MALLNEDRFEVTFRAGEMIFKQGSASTHALMLNTGLVKLYLEGHNGRNLILKIIKPVQMFGGPGMFLDQRNYYSAAAIEDTTVCFIDVKKFKAAIRSNPDFAENFIEHIHRNSIFTFGRFMDLTQKQMPGRVADALLYLSQDIYESSHFSIKLSRQDLADMTSLSKESFIRILKEFKDEGIIKMNGDTFEILNPNALKKISQFG
ncbi:MAG: Crp/Fnr family transcriptional regulator [Bacteroidales bacterium]